MSLFSDQKKEMYKQYADIIKWINLATLIYPDNDKLYHENLSSETIKMSAETLVNWGITDKETANHYLIYLYNGGTNFFNYKSEIGALLNEMRGGKTQNDDDSIKSILKKSACIYIQERYPEKGMIATDLTLGMYLSACFYVVGIYSFEEAMSTSIKMAQKLQEYFNDWDDCVENIFWATQCNLGISIYNSDSVLKTRHLYNKIKIENIGIYPVEWKMPLVDEWNASSLTYPNTVKWFNATKAFFNSENKISPHIYWPLLSKQANTNYLIENWEINNSEEFEKVISNLLKGERCNKDLQQELGFINNMSLADYILNESNNREKVIYLKYRHNLLKIINDNYPNQGIIAHDLYNAIHLTSCCYFAGHLTYQQSLDYSLIIAKTIQENFNSWDDYINNYLLGYQFLTKEILDNPNEIRELKEGELLNFNDIGIVFKQKLYQFLKKEKNSVYNIPWNTELKKEW